MNDRRIYAPLYQRIQTEIVGRIAVTLEEAECIAHYANSAPRWCEIGCLWGGTAIMAALAGAGEVMTIDPMDSGYWIDGDPSHDLIIPTPGHVLDNLVCFGIAHRVHIIKAASNPWPLPEEYHPDGMFIDGDHSLYGVLGDWSTAKRLRPKYVLIHDYQPDHPDVMKAIDEAIKTTLDWKFIEQSGSITVMKWRR